MNKKLIFIIIPLVLVGIIGFRLVAHNGSSGNTTQAVTQRILAMLR